MFFEMSLRPKHDISAVVLCLLPHLQIDGCQKILSFQVFVGVILCASTFFRHGNETRKGVNNTYE